MKTIDNQDPKEKGTDDPAKKGKDDDLTTMDSSKFTDEQKNDYIDKLKDENARRRIENKKMKESLEKHTSSLESLNSELTQLKTKLTEYDDKEKDKSLAEKSEIEKLQLRISEIEKGISEREVKITTLESELKGKDLKLEESGRERMVDRLATQLGIAFTSDYERKGLMMDLLKRKDGVFILTDDEVIYQLQTLAKERKKSPANTPGPGPQSRITEIPIMEEIKNLTSKEDLTLDDKKRLDELLVEVDKIKRGQS